MLFLLVYMPPTICLKCIMFFTGAWLLVISIHKSILHLSGQNEIRFLGLYPKSYFFNSSTYPAAIMFLLCQSLPKKKKESNFLPELDSRLMHVSTFKICFITPVKSFSVSHTVI
uniref:Uncharacterized protein n=1 Tax=Mus spicilegus TaxID=10103 RepID=A0A8C6HWT5_MUSSI